MSSMEQLKAVFEAVDPDMEFSDFHDRCLRRSNSSMLSEQEVLVEELSEKSESEVAEILQIGVGSVRSYRGRIKSKREKARETLEILE